jgi:hypothetical protein
MMSPALGAGHRGLEHRLVQLRVELVADLRNDRLDPVP